MKLSKLIAKLQEYPGDYTVYGDEIILDPNGPDWLNGETDIYLKIETLEASQPAKEFTQEETKLRIKPE